MENWPSLEKIRGFRRAEWGGGGRSPAKGDISRRGKKTVTEGGKTTYSKICWRKGQLSEQEKIGVGKAARCVRNDFVPEDRAQGEKRGPEPRNKAAKKRPNLSSTVRSLEDARRSRTREEEEELKLSVRKTISTQ